MPVTSGTLRSSNLVEILRSLVGARKTGYLKVKEGEHEGFVAVENGVIVNARNGAYTGLHALFQFVGWREARFDFHERPIPSDLSRDLAVYDAGVLITGVAFKVDELALLHDATPDPDAILSYRGLQGHNGFEATPADLGLLSLADGHRTVREIAEKLMMSPVEVARELARFRLMGVLKVVAPKARSKSALAEAG